jgi:hypothetical protein
LADFTNTITGNSNDGATFGNASPGVAGVDYPENGDNLVIIDGTEVTLPTGATQALGTSPDDDVSTPAVSCASSSGTGKFIVNGTFIMRGSVRQADVDFELGPGAVIEHDSSQATDPANTNYTWQIGMAAGQTNHLVARGTAGAGRVLVRNAAGSGKGGGFTGGESYTGAGGVDFEFVTVNGWRRSSGNNEVIMTNMTLASSKQRLINCIFDNCGPIGTPRSSMHPDSILELSYTSHLNPSDIYCYEGWESNSSDPSATGKRIMTNCIFDGALEIIYCRAIDFTGTAVWGASAVKTLSGEGGNRFECSAWGDALIHSDGQNTSNIVFGGDVTGVMMLEAGNTGELDFMRGGVNVTATSNFIDCVLVADQHFDGGEWFIYEGSPSALTTVTVTGNLQLPVEGTGGGSGKLVTNISNSANYNFIVDNNTLAVRDATALEDLVVFQSQIEGVAGTVESVRNNFIYNGSGTDRTSLITFENIPAAIDGMIVNASNNGSFGITGDQYHHADSKFQNAPPGANDVVADPQYVDDGVSFLGWAASVDPTLTTIDLWWQEAKKMNDDSGYNAALHWMEFHGAARAAFTPTNTALQGAGFDGSDIGAVPVQVSSGPTLMTSAVAA